MEIDNENYLQGLKYIKRAAAIDSANKETQILLKKIKSKLGMVTELDP